MKSILVWVFAAIFAVGAANAQPQLDEPAQAYDMSRADQRFLHAILSINGVYSGRLQARWDEDSQQALDLFSARAFGTEQPTWRMLAFLARNFETAARGGGWVAYHEGASNMSYLMPLSLLSRQPAQNEVVWRDNRAELLIRTRSENPEVTGSLHQWVVDNVIDNAPTLKRRKQDRMITAGILQDRIHTIHMRSVRQGDGFSTTIVQWRPQRQAAARLIVASIAMGEQAGLEIPQGGLLRQAVTALEQEESGVFQPQSDPQEPEPDQRPRTDGLVGTGFYVNNTDIVTASHVLEACDELRLRGPAGDDARLRVLARNPNKGLAVLTSPVRSNHWLNVPAEGQNDPDQQLTTLGIPGGRSFRGIAPKRGRVTDETLFGNNGLRLIVSMRPRPGDGGAPVFDRNNQLSGVVVSGPPSGDDRGAMVAPLRPLAGMLIRNRIQFRQQAENPQMDGVGIFQDARRAIVPLFCR